MAAPPSWPKGKKIVRERILALDILRGLFITIVAVDHFAWTPSLFIQFATEKSWLFASAAEGFFVISGMLVGYIYGPRLLAKTRPVVTRIWKRALLLYFLAVGFTLFYSLWHLFTPEYDRLGFIPQDLPTLLVNTFTLQYSYGWVDFLNRYAIFMLFAPIVLWFVAKGYWYIPVIASFALWLSQQFYPFFPNFTAWQILFVGGVVMGYYLPHFEQAVRGIPQKLRRNIFRYLIGAAIISYVGVVIWMFAIQLAHIIAPPDLLWIFHGIHAVYLRLDDFLERGNLGILRLLVGVFWFVSLFLFVRRYEKTIEKFTRGLLTLLGKNSLFVYCLQAFIIYLVDSIISPPEQSNILLNTILGVIFVTILVAATYYKEKVSTYRKRPQL